MKNNIRPFVIMSMLFVMAVITVDTGFAQKPQFQLRAGLGVPAEGRVSTRSSTGAVSVANKATYETAKTFTCVIDDARFLETDDDIFTYIIVDLAYLIDDLEGQPESQQLQAILRGLLRNTKVRSQVSAEIEAISKSYYGRLDAEKKWYFNVGATQKKLMNAGWRKDNALVSTTLKELQAMVRTAPKGTPLSVIDAIKGLSKYSSTSKFTEDAFTSLVDDAKSITNGMYA